MADRSTLPLAGIGVECDAVLSSCGQYRYRLTRRWGQRPGHALWVMLNPSKADDREDDPTIRKCVHFTRSWGLDALEVVNLFAWRATDPEALIREQRKGTPVVGQDNDTHIADALSDVGRLQLVVCAWGTWGASAPERVARVRSLAGELGVRLCCLGYCDKQLAHPRHPLMLRNNTERQPFPPEGGAR
jgi:hypothetical protein